MAVTPHNIKEILDGVREDGDPKLEIAPLAKPPNDLPAPWVQVLTHKDPTQAVFDILWKPMLKDFPKTIRVFRKSLRGLGLLKTRKRPPSLVYIVTQKKGKDTYAYRGFLPGPVIHPSAKKLPPEFLKFYQVHDGWVFLWDDSMGPLPVKSWSTLSEDPKNPGSRFVVVLENGGGAALGFDLEEDPPLCYIVWPDDNPEIVPDPWREIDKWIAGQYEDLDPA